MEEFKTYTLEELSLNKGTYGIAASAVPYDDSKLTYLRITDINDDGTLNTQSLMSVDEPNASDYLLKKNDIVFARTGNSTGRTYFYQGNECPLVYAGFLIKFSIDEKKVNPLLLKYYTHSRIYYDWVKSFDTGGTRGNINAKTYGNMPIRIPASRKTQDKIVDILSSLDEKIALNRRINDNLEQQAQALFKSWFVEKPNPQWTKGSLSDIASFVGGYSYKGDELVDSSNTGMATIKNYNRSGGFKTDGFKAINPSDKVKNAQYAELFEILVAHTDLTQNAEVIGNAELVLSLGEYNKIIFSMDLVKVLPSSSFPYRFLIAAMLKNKLFKGHCQGYVNGTTVLHLNKKALPEYKVMIPTDTEAKKMNEILGGYYKRMSENLKESDMLEQLRDTILPKLMSGELKINDLNC